MSQTSTSVEKAPRTGLEPTAADRAFVSLQRRAGTLARSSLVPRALKGKPDDVLLVMVQGAELGLTPVQSLSHLYVIEGKVVPSAQVQAGLARRDGHEIVVKELTRERCVVSGRRRGSRDWLTVEFNEDDARESGRLDRWVERWRNTENGKRKDTFLVGDDRGFFTEDDRRERGLPLEVPEWAAAMFAKGEIKRYENWYKHRKDMLRARGLSMICRTHFSDSLLGIGGASAFTPEELGEDWSADVEPDTPRDDQTHDEDSIPDDIEDADIVEPEPVGAAEQPPLYEDDDPSRPFEAA